MPGFEGVPSKHRYWSSYEHVHTEYLARTANLKPVIEVFFAFFSKSLAAYPIGESNSISVIDFCKNRVAESAMKTLLGPTIFELNDGFLDAFWKFDDNVFMLTLGLPRWLYSSPYKVHDRYLEMIEKYVGVARARFDWEGPERDSPWEPCFGARICRELTKWLTETDFLDQSISGALGALLFA
jgi:hypothetical protein